MSKFNFDNKYNYWIRVEIKLFNNNSHIDNKLYYNTFLNGPY